MNIFYMTSFDIILLKKGIDALATAIEKNKPIDKYQKKIYDQLIF